MVKYKRKYVKQILKCDKKKLSSGLYSRKILKIDLKNQYTDTMTFIMMNPSDADFNQSDRTINRVIKITFEQSQFKIGYINIVNLFPFYETYSENLYKAVKQTKSISRLLYINEMYNNFLKIKSTIQESKYITLAYSNPPLNFEKQVFDIQAKRVNNHIINFKNKYIMKDKRYQEPLNKKGYPRHPSRISYDKHIQIQIKNEEIHHN